MKAIPPYVALALAMGLFLAPEQGSAQYNDRRAGSGVPRNLERKEPLLLRNLFGKRRTGTEAPVAAPGTATTPPLPGQPAATPGAVVPVGSELAGQAHPTMAPGGDAPAAVTPAVFRPGEEAPPSVAPAMAASSASDSVAAAISKLAGKSGDEMISSASKALEGNHEELKTLARSVEADPSKILSEGKKLLGDPQLTASARQALEAVAKQGGAGSKVNASSLEEVKGLAEKVAADPGMVEGGKQFLSKNPDLLKDGKELLKDRKGLLENGKVKELLNRLPEVGGQLASLKTPVVIPVSTAVATGPLPPWVGEGVPAPRDPVADPIPRPEVSPEQMTRITAQFAHFNANTNVVTFEEDVELDHHQFDLSCQVLVAELTPGKDGSQPDPSMAKAQAAAGGIRRATAKGYVIIQKISAEGKIQVAKSREAIYDAVTGDVVLSDFPQLQDGNNLISGEEQTTKIYLRKNGKYEVRGRAEYIVVPEGSDPIKNLQR